MLNWTSFLSYVFVTTYTPGPNNIMSMNNAASYGFRKGAPFNFGIWAGFSLVMIFCALFSAVLYAIVPKIQLPMKILGASYMLYLAWKTAHSGGAAVDERAAGSFWSGFALQFVNPKIFIYGITAMSAYILPACDSPPALLFFALLLAFVGFSANLCWAAFGVLFLKLFSRHARAVKAAMVVLLVYSAVSLFL